MKKIALIGIGLMGHGIASNIIKKLGPQGYGLMLLEHTGNQPIADLIDAGARSSRDLHAVVADADYVLLCVTGSPQVESVMFGSPRSDTNSQDKNNGAIAWLKQGATVLDFSTALPLSTMRVAQAVAAKGAKFLDTPMTRTPKEAAEGRLNLLVGGDASVFADCQPILQALAENITHVGGVGAGHQMKLIHNYVSLGCATLIAEAAACAQSNGVAMTSFVDVLAKGGGGGIALERMKPYLLSGDPNGLRFSLANALKDLTYYTQMAQDFGAHDAIAQSVRATLAEYAQGEHANNYVPILASLLQKKVAP